MIEEPPWREFARAPLAPIALAGAVGLGVERFLTPPLEATLAIAAIGLMTALFVRQHIPLFLGLAFGGLAAAHLHAQRTVFAADDIGEFATTAPALVKLRGFLDEPPVLRKTDHTDLFGPARRVDRATTVLSVREAMIGSEPWKPASGLARVTVERDAASHEPCVLEAFHVGDEVEMVGLLSRPLGPGNPGERDYAAYLLDQRVRAELRITKGAEAVTRLEAAGWGWSRLLASLRGEFTRVIERTLPAADVPLGRALLLGDGSATDRDDWDAFARTGVIHVLAISGQHLVVLAGAAWLLLRIFGVPRRRGALAVMALIVVYAALTGARPSANRAAVMVCVYCGGILLRRPVSTANAFSLAWIIVVALDPADALTTGSLLSFLSVFVLIWGAARWLEPRPETPIEQLRREARPAWLNAVRGVGRIVLIAYAVNVILTIANTPLLIALQNCAPPIGILIGPPLVFLTTIALLCGFAMLIIGLVSPLAALPLAWITGLCLTLSRKIVLLADHIPGGGIYLPDPPTWWVAGFYFILVGLILAAAEYRLRLILALTMWTAIGLASTGSRQTDELRVTFLSVGHGGCTVLETPDGRVLLYDVGTMAGPDSVRRVVAPYLWSRGIRRVDELFLSHADLDHYNGLPELLRRFPIGQVTMTPSFSEKKTPEVASALLALEAQHVPRRLAVAGEFYKAGEVTISVLHPPLDGPAGSENERSLVLRVSHREHVFLLTGDLEKAGTTLLLSQASQPVDVLMAPHHGSPAALPRELMAWAQPRLVVVCRGPRITNLVNAPDAWDTWSYGAVTVRSHASGLTAESFRTKERAVLRRPK